MLTVTEVFIVVLLSSSSKRCLTKNCSNLLPVSSLQVFLPWLNPYSQAILGHQLKYEVYWS